jgi:hypothetical protein
MNVVLHAMRRNLMVLFLGIVGRLFGFVVRQSISLRPREFGVAWLMASRQRMRSGRAAS